MWPSAGAPGDLEALTAASSPLLLLLLLLPLLPLPLLLTPVPAAQLLWPLAAGSCLQLRRL
jgi:hypothetical protein